MRIGQSDFSERGIDLHIQRDGLSLATIPLPVGGYTGCICSLSGAGTASCFSTPTPMPALSIPQPFKVIKMLAADLAASLGQELPRRIDLRDVFLLS